MNKTVVAIFNSMEEAQTAADDLFDNGFLKENIVVSSGEKYEENEEGESAVTRFFKNLFGNHDETERYTKVAKERFVVAVHTHSQEEALKACEILDDHGAIDVNDHYRKNFAIQNEESNNDELLVENDDRMINTATDDEEETGTAAGAEIETIPVIEEDVQVHKKEVPTGGVRVKSRIVETPVEKNIRLREEHIHVDRKKVDRPPTEEELKNFKNATAEFTENTEIPEIEKTPRVVEEVNVNKDAHFRNESVGDQVRRTDTDHDDEP